MLISDRIVISLVVVILNEFVASSLYVGSCFEGFEVELVVLDGSGKPLNNHVVNGPAPCRPSKSECPDPSRTQHIHLM